MPSADEPIPYLERTRDYYAALGYVEAYRWAAFADVPFAPLGKPLRECRVSLVTTAAPYRPGLGEQGPGAAYNGAAKFHDVYSLPVAPPPDLRISHVTYDRRHARVEDPAVFLPLGALGEACREGRIGALASRLHSAPTLRSQRATLRRHAPEVLQRLREDGADVALLVAVCPVCHQTMTLVARYLEQHGVPTVVMGCALDIVERCGAPRYLWSDFPLGNPCGRAHDSESQRQTLELALRLLERATAPRSIERSPLRWSADSAWKRDFLNVEGLGTEELARLREEFEREKASAARARALATSLSPGTGTASP
ncbi:MAG TPA: glycine/sarcosine/betaine reductase selenoprotein B family protein [Thermoanaerobaculia bacterium]|nr:glycine/sarcosine/betaine reductase selenoprotein B family protein [Thermoanaerobaculia bacterium]